MCLLPLWEMGIILSEHKDCFLNACGYKATLWRRRKSSEWRDQCGFPCARLLWGVSYSPMWFQEVQCELLRHSKKTATSTSWDMRKTRVLMNFRVCYSLWKSLGHDTSDKIRDHMNWKGLYSNSMVVNRSSNQVQGLGHWTALLHLPSHWTFLEINTGILNECFSHLMSSPYMTVPKVNYLNMEIVSS